MNKKELQKQYDKIVEENINSGDDPSMDMYPIMEDIYYWGLSNITQKELKKIIERNK
jgi:hypothetical protein